MADVIKEYVNSKAKEERYNCQWWKEKPDEQYRHLFATVSMLESRQNYRSISNLKHARLYSNLEVLGVYGSMYAPQSKDSHQPGRITLNVVKSCVDTVTSKIAKAKPRPLFLTEGGDFELKKRAQSLTQFLDGSFDSMGIYEEKPFTFRNGAIFGTGPLKFYKDANRKMVCCERTMVEEILVDDAEGIYGRPKTLYQRRLVSREVLKELYPAELHDKIERATNGLAASFNSDNLDGLVKVVEAWHLPSVDGGADGLHTLAIDTVTLSTEKYEHSYFPFTFDRWNQKLTGFFGQGLPEELLGIQLEINKILRSIQESMHLFAKPRVWIEGNSVVSQINNAIGSLNKFTGNPPIFQTPAAMSPDIYQHLWQLVQKAYEITGVSQLSAMSKKPDGLNSGVALREFQDVESDRFQIVAQRYEQSFLDAARIVIDLTKELASETGKMTVKVSDQGSMKVIDWSEINLDEEKYLMRVFPTSILPTTPAGKLQTVTELVQAGFMDKDTATELLDFPDLKSAINLELAPRKIVFKILDKMVETGIYEPPEPFMDLVLTQSIATHYYLNAKNQDVNEDKLDLIRNFITDTETLTQVGQSAMAPPLAMGPQAPAVAHPEKPPVSDIMPISPQAQVPQSPMEGVGQ